MNWYTMLKGQWDRTAALLAVVLGLIALLLGWLGVSRSSLPTEQLPYLASGGTLGLFALGMGATLWLSADLRDEWRKLDEIHESIRAIAEQQSSDPSSDGASTSDLSSLAAALPAGAEPEQQPATKGAKRGRQRRTQGARRA